MRLDSSSSSFQIVADASAVINLNASQRAVDIIRAFPHQFVVTENACAELREGMRHGHDDWSYLERLIDDGVIHRVTMSAGALQVYESLVAGHTVLTLDDGEAATIGYASQGSALALIDERRAKRISAGLTPTIEVICTVELLLHSNVLQALSVDGQSAAILNALKGARMRVPYEFQQQVKDLIGSMAEECSSLPTHVRNRAN
jgi:predicted nucleic acid-binding protein